MSQIINVVKCCGCQMFQVEIKKQAKKWQCKVCGTKQSLIQVFFQGSAKQCRIKVQELNALKANGEDNAQNAQNSMIHNFSDSSEPIIEKNDFIQNTNSFKRFRPETNLKREKDEENEYEELENHSSKRIKLDQSENRENYINSDSIFSNILEEEDDNDDNNEESFTYYSTKSKINSSQIENDLDISDSIFTNVLPNQNEINTNSSPITDNVNGAKYEHSTNDTSSIFSNLLDHTHNEIIKTDINNVTASNLVEEFETEDFSLENTIDNKKELIKSSKVNDSIFQSNNDIDLTLDF